MGYHFHDLISLLFLKEKQSDYYEMLLHHIVTLTLYFCMGFGGAMPIGSVICFLHYIADIPVALCRLMSSTKYVARGIPIFFVLIACWIWTRLLSFGQIVWAILNYPHNEAYSSFMMLIFVFCFILLCIHVFYIFLLLDIVFSRIRKG